MRQSGPDTSDRGKRRQRMRMGYHLAAWVLRAQFDTSQQAGDSNRKDAIDA